MSPQPQHRSAAAAFAAPDTLPPDPADVAGWAHERAFVRERRDRGVSWFALADMCGRTVHDLRRDYDVGYVG